jgi:hypothetical protein
VSKVALLVLIAFNGLAATSFTFSFTVAEGIWQSVCMIFGLVLANLGGIAYKEINER